MIYLDPEVEYTNIMTWITRLVGKNITPKHFKEKLAKELTKRHPVRVKLYRPEQENFEEDEFTIGADYDCDLDQMGKKHITINLFINKDKRLYWPITVEIASRFALELTEALVHEYQHQKQYRGRKYATSKLAYTSNHRDYDRKQEQEYLGHPDELDAYAANIASRIWLMRTALNTNITHENCESLDLSNYYKTFGKKHSVVLDLLSRIQQHLTYLEDVKNGKIKRPRSIRSTIRKPRL